MLVFIGILSAMLLIAIGYGMHRMQKQQRSRKRVYVLILLYSISSILLSIIVLSMLHHSGLIEKMNYCIKRFVALIWGVSEDGKRLSAMLSLYSGCVDILSLATSIFGVGFIIISLASTRLRSDINPYELMDYFPVCIYSYLLVHLLVAITYLSMINLNYVLVATTILLAGFCFTVPVYIYFCHTIDHISSIMCNMLRKVTVKQLSKEKSIDCVSHKIFVHAITHVQKWQRTFLQEEKDSGINVRVQCHAGAFYKYWNKYNVKYGGSDSQELAFVLGYHALLPTYEAKGIFERKYFHQFVNEYISRSKANSPKIEPLDRPVTCPEKRYAFRIANKYKERRRNDNKKRKEYDKFFISGVIVERFILQSKLWEAKSSRNGVEQIATHDLNTWDRDCSIALGDDWQMQSQYYDPTYCLLGILVYCATYMTSDQLKWIFDKLTYMQISAEGIRQMSDHDLEVEISKFLSTFDHADKLMLGMFKHITSISSMIREAIGENVGNHGTGGIKYDLPCQ